jgi:hypothetical protein
MLRDGGKNLSLVLSNSKLTESRRANISKRDISSMALKGVGKHSFGERMRWLIVKILAVSFKYYSVECSSRNSEAQVEINIEVHTSTVHFKSQEMKLRIYENSLMLFTPFKYT